MHIYICENTLEGVWSAVFQAYADRFPHEENKIVTGKVSNYELFAQYHTVTTNPQHALRVSQRLNNTFGYNVYYDLCAALFCEGKHAQKAVNAVYHTIVLGLRSRHPERILDSLTNPYVEAVFAAARETKREAGHFLEFSRFRELSNKVLLCVIHPQNYVMPFLTDHFDNRMPLESFIIYDADRDLAALHHPSQPSIFIHHPEFAQEALTRYSEEEQQYEELWIQFFHSIEISARRNPKLQQQNIPKRFWKDTVELHP
ncbi:MAG: TIGR03915 family putative DNA repair protein [Lachnospiraceae bacterium]|nr:TIGR03915 family putative DNA repair protein [Lachnospiraceae bacterium]